MKKKYLIFIIIILIIIIIGFTCVFINTRNNNIKNISKEDFYSLVDKGIESNKNVEAFIYSKNITENEDTYMNIYHNGKYKELVDSINLYEYEDSKYQFSILKNTDSYIWVSFSENINDKFETTYIVFDITNNMIKSLNSNLLQVSVL